MAGTSSKESISKAIAKTRRLITHLRTRLNSTAGSAPEEADYLFVSTWGMLTIQGEDAEQYRACRDALFSIHGHNSERRLISRRIVENLLIEALLRTLRPASNGYEDPWPTFDRRVRAELRRLRKGLSESPHLWQLTTEVTGLARTALPLTFGRVRFELGTSQAARRIASNLLDFQPRRQRISMKKRLAEGTARQKSRDEVTRMFSENAIAHAEVVAFDPTAAKERGLNEIRRTIDVLNFFTRYFGHRGFLHQVFLSPEARGSELRWAVHDPISRRFSYNSDTINEWGVKDFRIKSRLARKVGLTRIHHLLANENRSDLEERIVTAAAWAGRARTARRKEESFLLYAIALESLLARPNARGGVTDRLKLAAAHLVHRKPKPRRALANTVGRLYQIRSALVHSGSADDLADQDIKVIDKVVELVLLTMLTRDPFKAMINAAAFEQWFNDSLLGG